MAAIQTCLHWPYRGKKLSADVLRAAFPAVMTRAKIFFARVQLFQALVHLIR